MEIASVVRGSKRIWKKINSNQRSNSIQFSSEARGRGAELNWIWSEVWIYFLSRWVCFRGQQRQFILNIMNKMQNFLVTGQFGNFNFSHRAIWDVTGQFGVWQSNLEFSPRTKFQINFKLNIFPCGGMNYFLELFFFFWIVFGSK